MTAKPPPRSDARSLAILGIGSTVALGMAALPLSGGWQVRLVVASSSFVVVIFLLSRFPQVADTVVRWLTRPVVAISCIVVVGLVALLPGLVAYLSEWSAPSWLPAVAWSALGTIAFFNLRAVGLYRRMFNGAVPPLGNIVLLMFTIVIQGALGGIVMLALLNDSRESVLSDPLIALIVGIAAGAVINTSGEVVEAFASHIPIE